MNFAETVLRLTVSKALDCVTGGILQEKNTRKQTQVSMEQSAELSATHFHVMPKYIDTLVFLSRFFCLRMPLIKIGLIQRAVENYAGVFQVRFVDLDGVKFLPWQGTCT